MNTKHLQELATEARRRTVRAIKNSGSGHPGGSLSVVDILTTLYFHIACPQPYDIDNPERDIIILSKGHAAPGLYSVLSLLPGGPTEAEVMTLRKLGSPFQGHPSWRHLDWVETSTGSLGQGFAVAAGMALALKRQAGNGHKPRRVYVVLGDGECQEGIIWETAQLAAHYQLGNLTAIVDMNLLASDRHSMKTVNLPGKFRAFGWNTEWCDGHNFEELAAALRAANGCPGKPTAVIASTVKGCGWPKAEADPDGMHGSVTLSDEDLADALEAIGG